MKTEIIFKIHTIILFTVIGITSFTSYTGNGSFSQIKSVDNMNSTSYTMSTATSENEQIVRIKNDTAAIR